MIVALYWTLIFPVKLPEDYIGYWIKLYYHSVPFCLCMVELFYNNMPLEKSHWRYVLGIAVCFWTTLVTYTFSTGDAIYAFATLQTTTSWIICTAPLLVIPLVFLGFYQVSKARFSD